MLADRYAICACGWHGEFGYERGRPAPCPACRRPPTERMNGQRIDALRAVRMRTDATLVPRMRIRLIEIDVIKPIGPRTPPTGYRRKGHHAMTATRHHTLTELGLAVLAAADAVEQQQRQGAA